MISDDFWETRFARDPGIQGRAVRLNESPFTVIGVGTRRFTGEVVGSPTLHAGASESGPSETGQS